MDNYIKSLTDLILRGSMENTYKMAWGRALVEICQKDPGPAIHFDQLSELIFKYYWNQTFFFDLRQGPNLKKPPKICQIVKESIDQYKKYHGNQPQSFIRISNKVQVPLNEITTVLKQDVSYRFLKLDKVLNIYEYDLSAALLKIAQPDLIASYAEILYPLINYRWTQKLEDLDGSPRIAQKIRGVDKENTPRRGSLKKFHSYLDIENPKRVCFISGEPLEDKNLSVDHVIPWSYLYSDDLWNLVYVKKGLNSAKSNRLPDEHMINRLEERNIKLNQLSSNGTKKGKPLGELQIAIDKNYVKRFWNDFRMRV